MLQLEQVGQGSFGTVIHAAVLAGPGPVDVAIKLLPRGVQVSPSQHVTYPQPWFLVPDYHFMHLLCTKQQRCKQRDTCAMRAALCSQQAPLELSLCGIAPHAECLSQEPIAGSCKLAALNQYWLGPVHAVTG